MAGRKEKAPATVDVFIPKETKHDDSLFVSVNGQRILVKKGESVKLSPKYAEVINNSFEAQKQAESYIESVMSEA